MLLSGRGVSFVLGLLAFGIMARVLGATQFGTLMLIHTYAVAIKRLCQFQSSETVIRYGVPFQREGEVYALGGLVWFASAMDVVSALTSALIAVLGAPLLAALLGWDDETRLLAQHYSILLFFALDATPKGVLRLLDRFDLLAMQIIIRPIVRLAAVGIAYLSDGGMRAYLLSWFIANWVDYLSLQIIAWVQIHRRLSVGRPSWKRICAMPKQMSGHWRFARNIYFRTVLEMARSHLSVLFVGGLLSVGDAGLFKVAKEFTGLLDKPANSLRQSIFPELTRLWTDKNPLFNRMLLHAGLLAGTVSLGLLLLTVLFGEAIVGGALGSEYVAAAPVMALLILGGTVDLYCIALRPGADAMGYAHWVMSANLAAVVVFFGSMAVLGRAFGLLGVGLAAPLASLVDGTLQFVLIRRFVKRHPLLNSHG